MNLFDCIAVRDLYKGITLKVSGEHGNLKLDYWVEPLTDPSQIRIRYEAAELISVSDDGTLNMETDSGMWAESAPTIYQESAGAQRKVDGRYEVSPDGIVSFVVGDYDRTRALIIDPLLSYSSLIGGSGNSNGTAVAVDANGFLYVAGHAETGDLPTPGSLSGWRGGVDAYVIKIEPDTGRIVYATYLGGSGDDRAFGISVDSAGNAYVTGWTTSADFPVLNASRNRLSGYRDAFLAALSPFGNTLLFCTYYGDTGVEDGSAVILANSSVYIAGNTTSPSLPGSIGLASYAAGMQDGYIAKFSMSGAIQSVRIIGGSGVDQVKALAAGPSGLLYVGGSTDSPNLPTTVGKLQPSPAGGQDGFVVGLPADLSQILAATYLGGSQGGWTGFEGVNGLAVDIAGNVYVAGTTPSTDFPTRSAWNATHAGQLDVFLARFDSTLTTLHWSTYFGGAGKEMATGVALAPNGTVFVGGSTTSTNLPLANPIQGTNQGAAEGMLFGFSDDGTQLRFSSYLGGQASEGVNGVAAFADGSIAMTGQSGSPTFPARNPSQTPYGMTLKMILARASTGTVPVPGTFSAVAGAGLSGAFTFSANHPGGASQITTLELLLAPSLAHAQACRVRYVRQTGLLYVADAQGLFTNGIRPGGTGSVAGPWCTINASASAQADNGNVATITANLTFTSGFEGPKQAYINAGTTAAGVTGFTFAGGWTVSNAVNFPPTAISVTPSSGKGLSQSFSFQLSDANGGGDIRFLRVVINDLLLDRRGCSMMINPVTRQLSLVDDEVTMWLPTVQFGSSQTTQNSQCSVRMTSSSLAVSGNTLTVVIGVDFSPLFSGVKNIYIYGSDQAHATFDWTRLGSWEPAPAVANQIPVVHYLYPSQGNGVEGMLSFALSDADGAQDITSVRVQVGGGMGGAASCSVLLNPQAQTLSILNDSGTGWSASVPVAGGPILENSQCWLFTGDSVFTYIGNVLYLTLDLAFKSSFAGSKQISSLVTDVKGGTPGWVVMGSWTVHTGQPDQMPLAVSLRTTSNSGNRELFHLRFSDANGYRDLISTRILINGPLTTVGGCYVMLNQSANIVYLADDQGTAWAPVRLGMNEMAQNSQCSIYGATSKYTTTRNSVLLDLDIGFKSAFRGVRSVWANATDGLGLTCYSPLLGGYSVTP